MSNPTTTMSAQERLTLDAYRDKVQTLRVAELEEAVEGLTTLAKDMIRDLDQLVGASTYQERLAALTDSDGGEEVPE